MALQRKSASRQARGTLIEPMHICPRCGTRLQARQCKLLCERCGYYMSCSDFV
ncbi:MAG: hypothetical protein ACE5H2_08175 [Terriglobia bacterium]